MELAVKRVYALLEQLRNRDNNNSKNVVLSLKNFCAFLESFDEGSIESDNFICDESFLDLPVRFIECIFLADIVHDILISCLSQLLHISIIAQKLRGSNIESSVNLIMNSIKSLPFTDIFSLQKILALFSCLETVFDLCHRLFKDLLQLFIVDIIDMICYTQKHMKSTIISNSSKQFRTTCSDIRQVNIQVTKIIFLNYPEFINNDWNLFWDITLNILKTPLLFHTGYLAIHSDATSESKLSFYSKLRHEFFIALQHISSYSMTSSLALITAIIELYNVKCYELFIPFSLLDNSNDTTTNKSNIDSPSINNDIDIPFLLIQSYSKMPKFPSNIINSSQVCKWKVCSAKAILAMLTFVHNIPAKEAMERQILFSNHLLNTIISHCSRDLIVLLRILQSSEQTIDAERYDVEATDPLLLKLSPDDATSLHFILSDCLIKAFIIVKDYMKITSQHILLSSSSSDSKNDVSQYINNCESNNLNYNHNDVMSTRMSIFKPTEVIVSMLCQVIRNIIMRDIIFDDDVSLLCAEYFMLAEGATTVYIWKYFQEKCHFAGGGEGDVSQVANEENTANEIQEPMDLHIAKCMIVNAALSICQSIGGKRGESSKEKVIFEAGIETILIVAEVIDNCHVNTNSNKLIELHESSFYAIVSKSLQSAKIGTVDERQMQLETVSKHFESLLLLNHL